MRRRPPCPPDKNPLIWDLELYKMETEHLRLLAEICLETGNALPDTPRYASSPAAPISRKDLPPIDRWAVMTRDNFTCYICGKTELHPDEIHLDHIKPLSKGGVHHESNIGVTCKRCNLDKSDLEYPVHIRPKALLKSVTSDTG